MQFKANYTNPFRRLKSFYVFVVYWLSLTVTVAQSPEVLNISIISENEEQVKDLVEFENQIKSEINQLLVNRRTVNFNSEYCKCSPVKLAELIEATFQDEQTDIIVTVGSMASAILAQRKSFPKPAISSFIIDNGLQNVPITPQGTSGINNFTYIQSPFSFKEDLNILYDIYPFKKVGIIRSKNLDRLFPNFEDLFSETAIELQAEFVSIAAGNDAASTLAALPEDVDAAYVFPLFDKFTPDQYPLLFEGLVQKGLPSVALMGEEMVEQGALVGFQNQPNIDKLPRRIAINISKIVDGANAADLPVQINTFSQTVVINMNTVREVGAYPNWDIVSEAILLNVNDVQTDRQLTLESVIVEALEKNLALKANEKDPRLAQQEVQLAKAELLPQVDANTVVSLIDENSALNSFGTRGRVTWTASGSLSQLVYAEPAWANLAIQEYLKKGEEYGLQTTLLDVIVDAASAYLSVLQAKSFLEIQSANVSVTKNNLDIAKAKDAVGYSGATDLNRWISELALAKIDQNDAQAQYEQAKYALNQFLNHPIREEFQTEEVGVSTDLLMVNDERLLNQIQNEKELEQLGDFFVSEAMINLPELKEIDAGLSAQRRLLKSQKRAFYLPTFAITGGLDYILERWDVTLIEGFPAQEIKPSWNLGLAMQYPILEGGRKRFDQEKTEIGILQIQDQRADVRNQLELRVRANLQTASAAYFRVSQYEKALKAANDNFDIIQDSYSQGLVSITNLIDAQNAKVQTQLGAANAGYQFIVDFLEVERSMGFYYHLMSISEKDAFFERLFSTIVQKK